MDTKAANLEALFFKKSIRKSPDQISLTSDMLKVLAAIDGKKDMAEVAYETGIKAGQLRQTLAKLYQLGLIEKVERKIVYLNKNFYNIMRKNLTYALGPVADFVLEDILSEMALSPEKIPAHRASDLIGRAAGEITDPGLKKEFETSMLKLIPA